MNQPDPQPEQLIRVVDALMDELARLAVAEGTEAKEFFAQLHDTVQTVLNPRQVAVVAAGPDQVPYIVGGGADNAQTVLDSWTAYWQQHDQLPREVIQFEHRSRQFSFASVWEENGKCWGAVVVENEDAPLQTASSVLGAIAAVVAEFVATQQQAINTGQGNFLQRFFEFSLSAHSSLESNAAATILANDARLLFAAERAQLYEAVGSRIQLKSVSAVAVVERRTALLKRAKQLAVLTARARQPLLSSQVGDDALLADAFADYLALSGMEFVACFPLRSPFNKTRLLSNGVLIVEFTRPPSQFEFVSAAKFVLPHLGLSVDNARRYSIIPFRKSIGALVKLLRVQNISRLAIGLIMLLVVVVLLFSLQSDFKMRINGELRPQTERVVFAPHDAFVDRVLVEYGQRVDKGELLAVLSSPSMQQELEQVQGELAKLQDLKLSKRILLNQAATGNVGDTNLQTELASEIADLEFQLQLLSEKRDFINGQLAELKIHAPITGTVVTWDVRQVLRRKPVHWGDPLLKLADEESQWELRLQAPENKIAYILEAARRQDEALTVKYFYNANPNERFESAIKTMANSTETDAEIGPSVAIVCDIDPAQSKQLHGAKVVVDVVCGRRSIGYLWTYEIIDTVKRQFVW